MMSYFSNLRISDTPSTMPATTPTACGMGTTAKTLIAFFADLVTIEHVFANVQRVRKTAEGNYNEVVIVCVGASSAEAARRAYDMFAQATLRIQFLVGVREQAFMKEESYTDAKTAVLIRLNTNGKAVLVLPSSAVEVLSAINLGAVNSVDELQQQLSITNPLKIKATANVDIVAPDKVCHAVGSMLGDKLECDVIVGLPGIQPCGLLHYRERVPSKSNHTDAESADGDYKATRTMLVANGHFASASCCIASGCSRTLHSLTKQRSALDRQISYKDIGAEVASLVAELRNRIDVSQSVGCIGAVVGTSRMISWKLDDGRRTLVALVPEILVRMSFAKDVSRHGSRRGLQQLLVNQTLKLPESGKIKENLWLLDENGNDESGGSGTEFEVQTTANDVLSGLAVRWNKVGEVYVLTI